MVFLLSWLSDFAITIFLLSRLKYIPGADVHSNTTVKRRFRRFYFAIISEQTKKRWSR